MENELIKTVYIAVGLPSIRSAVIDGFQAKAKVIEWIGEEPSMVEYKIGTLTHKRLVIEGEYSLEPILMPFVD